MRTRSKSFLYRTTIAREIKSGKVCQWPSQLPGRIRQQIVKSYKPQKDDYSIGMEMDRTVESLTEKLNEFHQRGDLQGCIGICQRISEAFRVQSFYQNEMGDESEVQVGVLSMANVFNIFGGVDLILRIVKKPNWNRVKWVEKTVEDELIKEALQVLTLYLALESHSFKAHTFAGCKFCTKKYDWFIAHLFSLLGYKKNNIPSCSVRVLDEILEQRCELGPFELEKVANIGSVLNSENIQLLGTFCKVLSCLVFDHEELKVNECMKDLVEMKSCELEDEEDEGDGNVINDTLELDKNMVIGEQEGNDVYKSTEVSQFANKSTSHAFSAIPPPLNNKTSNCAVVENNQRILLHTPKFIDCLMRLLKCGLEPVASSSSRGENSARSLNFRSLIESIFSYSTAGAPHSPPSSADGVIDELEDLQLRRDSRNNLNTGDRFGIIDNIENADPYTHVETVMGNIMASLGGGEFQRNNSSTIGGRSLNGNVDVGQSSPNEQNLETPSFFNLNDSILSSFAPVPSYALMINQVEAMFVINSLLSGVHKRQTQKLLLEAGLIDVLYDFHRQVNWENADQDVMLELSNEMQECNPELAQKIQYLRLIHNLFDGGDAPTFRRLFYSDEELGELQALNSPKQLICQSSYKYEPMDVMFHTPYAIKRRSRGKGLITLLIDTLCLESPASSVRLWLSSAIESFLRGSSPLDKVFVIKKGLLKHLKHSIFNQQSMTKSNIQCTFDLLGELLKFNVDGWCEMSKLLNEKELILLTHMIEGSLVNSNVFVRSLILSLNCFSSTNNSTSTISLDNDVISPAVNISSMKIFKFLTFERKMSLIRSLINTFSAQTVCQENICCLNTCLIIFILAARNGEICHYLEYAKKNWNRETKTNLSGSEDALQGTQGSELKMLRDLVVFWKRYYKTRTKDLCSLENSTRIAHREWNSVVNLLLSSKSSECSIKHFL
eukprot:Nk52_evm19s223 gene=Nk52_evmTU19s223